MNRKELIKRVEKYFSVKEIVCPDVYKRFGNNSWRFIDDSILEVLVWLRETIKKPILINNWNKNGDFSQRGLRCTNCSLVRDKSVSHKVYLSAHILGKAVDFDVKGMTAEDVRNWIDENKENLPHNIRLEKDVNWVHCDTLNYTNEKIVYF